RTRLFHMWFLWRRPMTLGVRALAINELRQVMLVKHTYVKGWHLPGGGVEPGESAVESLARELAEEANIQLKNEPSLIGFFFNKQASGRDHVALYLCKDVQQTAQKEKDREIIAARFFDMDALPDDISPATKRRIDEWRSGSVSAGYW
ncbi:MAG: NUDIX domain-containing protein, partial [Pseudomonadota bacterium]